jgi:hypothetical protein
LDRARYSVLLAGSFQQWLNSACWLAQPKPIRAHDRSHVRAGDKSLARKTRADAAAAMQREASVANPLPCLPAGREAGWLNDG